MDFFFELFPHHFNKYKYFDYASSLNTPHVHCNVVTCKNIHIYWGIFEYLFEMTASYDMLKNIQSTSSEHVKEYFLE
jgi:hypothetical protein